jgi:hypothetical protein
MKRRMIAIAAALALPALVCIAQPSRDSDNGGEPTGPPPVSPGPGGPHGGGGGGGPGEHRAKRDFKITQQDSDDTMAFIQKTSPLRAQAMAAKGWKPTPFMVMRFLEFRRLREEDPELYELRIQEVQKEDKISDLVEKFKQSPDDSALKTELVKEVAAVIELRIKESDHRIAKLSEQIEAEKGRLTQLHDNDAVQKRLEYYMSQSNPWAGSGLGAGHGGGHRHENSGPPTAAPTAAPTTAPVAVPVASPTTAPSP